MNNPYQKPGTTDWWFLDEAEMEYGPYMTKEIAEKELKLYCSTYLDHHSTDAVMEDVEAFSQKFGRPVGTQAGDNFQDVEQRRLRAALVLEEALEFVDALGFDPDEMYRSHQRTLDLQRARLPGHGSKTCLYCRLELQDRDDIAWGFHDPCPPRKPDLAAAMDAVADLIYVAAGAAVTFGVHLGPVWTEVQKTNMAKELGRVREDGKILKGPGWLPPDIESILWAQGYKKQGDDK